jgi:hypothetical protein
MTISRDELVRDLVEFFLDGFEEDAVGVGDWLAQGDYDADEFYEAVLDLKATL